MKPLTVFLKGGLIAALLLTVQKAGAQSVKIDHEMENFFVGRWEGTGQFANGKPVEADVTFYLSVDSCHLVNMYSDRPPNRYKATADWINDPSGNVTAHVINNFTALKDFAGTWQNGTLTILNKENYPGRGMLYQSFIYNKIDDDHFKVSYVYGPGAAQMKEGDHLIFSRVKQN